MITKLLRYEILYFRERLGRQAKRFEAYWKYDKNLFATPDEVTAENIKL